MASTPPEWSGPFIILPQKREAAPTARNTNISPMGSFGPTSWNHEFQGPFLFSPVKFSAAGATQKKEPLKPQKNEYLRPKNRPILDRRKAVCKVMHCDEKLQLREVLPEVNSKVQDSRDTYEVEDWMEAKAIVENDEKGQHWEWIPAIIKSGNEGKHEDDAEWLDVDDEEEYQAQAKSTRHLSEPCTWTKTVAVGE